MTPATSRLDSTLRVLAIVSACVLVGLLTFVPLGANDTWLQAKIGELIVDTGSIPRTVLFPFTWVQANPFNAHEWLPSIVFHVFDRAIGLDHMLFVTGGIGLIVFVASTSLARWQSGSLAVGLLLGLMTMVVANYRFELRPELFGLMSMVALLHVLTRYRRSGDWRMLCWTVPIGLLWANCHGSFVLGPILAGIFALGEAAEAFRRRTGGASGRSIQLAVRTGMPYLISAGAMSLVSLVNPLGWELLRFALTLSTSEVTKTFIVEWQPTLSPWFRKERFFLIFVAALMITLAIAACRRRRVTATDVLLLIAFAGLALQSMRFVALFGFISLVVCSGLLAGRIGPRLERALLAAAAAASAVGIGLALQFGNVMGAYPYSSPSNNFTEPMANLVARPTMTGNVLNSYSLGAELIYRGYPRLRPSIDSRIDSYGDTYFLLQDQLFADEPLLMEFIADFDIRYMLLLWRDFEQLKKMKNLHAAWRMEFADFKMVLLRRVGPATRLPLPPPRTFGPAAAPPTERATNPPRSTAPPPTP